MRLLLTNDDGIDCIFLHILVRALRTAGHTVWVVAPATQQSWIGAAKSRHRPVKSIPVDRGLDCPTWSVDGTPSDCVNIGLAHLLPSDALPEAVVSGINVGLNASLAFILASGTIGGAWEGALHGLPAVALSQDLPQEVFAAFQQTDRIDAVLKASLEAAAAHATRLLPELTARSGRFIVHNLNFPYPCRHDTGLRVTEPAQVIVPGLFSPAQDDGTHRFIFSLGEDASPHPALTDRAALAEGLISHTVLDYTRLGAL